MHIDYSNLSSFLSNPILDTDSYKVSHYLQYPPGATAMFSYVESRGGVYDRTVFFGLQMILKQTLCAPITDAMIDEAKAFFTLHGEPFNEAGWRYIVSQHGGYLPVRIRAVPEGSVVPTGHALMTVECDDPEVFWLASYLETLLLRVWYPITVATQSWHVRQTIRRALEKSSDDMTQLPFKLHDFGGRGVSSPASAAIGGAAHLVSFMGSDTVLGVMAANRFYREDMAAYSVPAAEHSTITAWGRAGEADAYANMLRQFAKPGAIVAVVSDSYDLFAALDMWGTQLKQQVIDSGATLVIRPDSGDPLTIVLASLRKLDGYFGSTVNSKGRRVLNHVRVLQGDGVNPDTIATILDAADEAGYGADNLVFGIGGALLQRVDRDTQRFAMKCSAIRVGDRWRDVMKDPVTDAGKRSKAGRLVLLRHVRTGEYRTAAMPCEWSDAVIEGEWEDAMHTVYESGRLLVDTSLADVRVRAQAGES